jgi:AcrR family transcriptional regulator
VSAERTRAARDRAGAIEAPARRRGRPRSEEAHQAILTAVIELLPVHGLQGLTVEAVAAHAGVGKTTIYRRWATKNEMVVEAIEQLRPEAAPPDTGSLEGDLKAMVALQRRRLEASQLPRVMPRVLGEAMDDPELHGEIVERAVQPIRDMLTAMVRRAIERGELRADLDVEMTVDILHALPVYKLLMSSGTLDALFDVPGRAVPLLLEGISSSSAGRASARQRSSGSSRARRARSA